MPTMDPGALRAALERQQGGLAPVARLLAAAAAHPPRLDHDDWRGEAAQACERLEARLRSLLSEADEALDAAQRCTRAALAELGVER
ncbi:hypothetical protein ACFPJ4_08290 [Lysinimonas soli]|uniref:Uncharacterized protein n=1 Tax=Lysinimonas soli TaxID=1074233 RepID=A0ABW0NP88_9MICO